MSSFLSLTVENTGSGRKSGKRRACWEAAAMFAAAGVKLGAPALHEEAAVRWSNNLNANGKLPDPGLSRREVSAFLATSKDATIAQPKDWETLVKLESAKLSAAKTNGFADLEKYEFKLSVGEGQKSPDVIKEFTKRPATEAEIAQMVAFFSSVDIGEDEADGE